MLSHKIVNILLMLFLLISPLFAGGSQVLSQVAQATGGQPALKGPYPNDTIGGTNSGTGQMRTTTQAMREAAAYRSQQQKGVNQKYAGIDQYNGLSSPLSYDPNASISPSATTPLGFPDYFGVANWANSPLPLLDAAGAIVPNTGMRKFVDALPVLCPTVNVLGQCIPLAVADTTSFPGNGTTIPAADYYEIALVEYREQMHSDLPPVVQGVAGATPPTGGTLLRGYVQVVPSTFPGAVPLDMANSLTKDIKDKTGAQVFGATKPHYLGPLILSTRNRPVRVKFTNYLPVGAGGDLFLPTDTTYMGAGMGPGGSIYSIGVVNGGAGYTTAPAVVFNNTGTGGTGAAATASIHNGAVVSILVTNGGSGYATAPTVTLTGGGATTVATATAILAGLPGEPYTENRATLHLHGGNSPWISDGTTMQWTVPVGETTSYQRGDSVAFVPDMCFDSATGAVLPTEQLTCPATASHDPGLGAETFYWTNQQSGRLMFFHDHAYGMTRLDVYAGEAAGYLLADPLQESTLATLGVPGTIVTDPITGAIVSADLAHLVPLVIQDKTFVPSDVLVTDPTWDTLKYGGLGSLWLPHVYMPNQNPVDLTGANAFGRWDYGPWFWPPQNPSTFVADGLPVTDPLLCKTTFYGGAQPPLGPLVCPGTPNPSGTPESFMDTPVVNGTPYPTLTVDPAAYRFQILNAANDRTINLGLYVADPLTVAVSNGGSGYSSAPTVTFSGGVGGGTGVAATANISTGVVSSILVTNVGSGYLVAPLVSFTNAAGDTTGAGAAAVAVIDPITSTVSAINVTNPGTGYTLPPLVTITAALGDPGINAAASANITPAGVVLSVTVTNPGSAPWTTAPAVSLSAPQGAGGIQAIAYATANTEVKMVPAVTPTAASLLQPCSVANPTSGAMLVTALVDATGPINGTGLQANCWPSGWPVDGRDGGVPDPRTAGPAIIQIGTEGGLLPSPVAIASTPVGYEFNRRSITVLNIFTHGLLMGPAERADVVVDFSLFAGKTIIVYNDAPAPVPAFDPRWDYYTGNPDMTATGGAPSTLAGYGPNTRTLMQITVNATGVPNAVPFNLNKLTPATAQPALFATTQERVIVPETAYPAANGGGPANYARIQDNAMTAWIGGPLGGITLTSGGAGYTAAPTITITGGGATTNAVATANLAGTSVASVTLTNGGSGYTSAPTVAFAGTGTGAAATAALVPGGVGSVTVTNRGSGYTSVPLVAFSAPQTLGGTTATGHAVVVNRRVTSIVVDLAGTGYTAAPIVSITGGGGSGATAVALLAPRAVGSITLTGGGSGYTAAPIVSFAGGGGTGAAADAVLTPTVVASVTLVSAGTGYTSAPTITFSAPQTAGSTATGTGIAPTTQMLPKTIQELFTLDYGRMNATLGVELPFTNFLTQTTIPYGYTDPPTEIFQDGEVQIWKLTHNGVDTHFIHFHLFTVQVINRVGWDGAIKPPDSNELSFKDTVRMNPLEDIIFALHPLKQNLPWELPLSTRPLDVTESIGSAMPNQFTNVDPTNQPAAVSNAVINFGYEYVWHCHILGHEENDMMRAMVFVVPPAAPSGLGQIIPVINTRAVKLTWTDNALHESGFTIQRSITDPAGASGPSWVTVGHAAALPGTGTATFLDTTVARRTVYWYQVIADNLVGYTQVYAAPAAGYPNRNVASAPSNSVMVTTNNSTSIAPFGANALSPFVFANSFQNGTLGWTGAVGTLQTIKPADMGPDGSKLGMIVDLSAAGSQGSYVFDHSPAGLTNYLAAFEFNPNGAISGSSPIDIFVGLDQNGQQAFGIQFQRILVEAEPRYQVRSWVQQSGDQAFSQWFNIENVPTRLELGWASGASAGFSLYINDFLAQTLTGDTSGRQLLDVLLGPSGGLTGASGSLYFDEFTSSTLNGIEYNIFLPQIVQ